MTASPRSVEIRRTPLAVGGKPQKRKSVRPSNWFRARIAEGRHGDRPRGKGASSAKCSETRANSREMTRGKTLRKCPSKASLTGQCGRKCSRCLNARNRHEQADSPPQFWKAPECVREYQRACPAALPKILAFSSTRDPRRVFDKRSIRGDSPYRRVRVADTQTSSWLEIYHSSCPARFGKRQIRGQVQRVRSERTFDTGWSHHTPT